MERSEGRTLFVIIVIPSGDIRPVLLGQSATAFSREVERRAFPFPQDIKSSRRASNVGPSRYARTNLLSFCDRPDSTPLPLLCQYSRGEGRKHWSSLWRRRRGVRDWWQFPFPWQGCGPEDRALSYIRGNWLDAWNFFPSPSGSETRRAECKSFVSISSL